MTDMIWTQKPVDVAAALDYPTFTWTPPIRDSVYDEMEDCFIKYVWTPENEQRNRNLFIELLMDYGNYNQLLDYYTANGGLLDICHSNPFRYPHSPLEIAIIFKRSLAFVKRLVDKGAHPGAETNDGRTMQQLARDEKLPQIAFYLWEAEDERCRLWNRLQAVPGVDLRKVAMGVAIASR